jgi:hypothetical protein
MREYPEHIKLRETKPDSDIIGAFIEWLGENQYFICRDCSKAPFGPEYAPIDDNIIQLLANYFKIDLSLLEKEKCELLAELREENMG